jgi:hypothetical protein
MIPEVREGILKAEIPIHYSEYTASNDLILQLQKLFTSIKYSDKKAYSPDSWVFAYKDENGILPVNVSQQQV